MTNTKNRSQKEAATMKTLGKPLEEQVSEVRDALAKALVKGDATTKLREWLIELEAQHADEQQQIAAKNRAAAEAARAAQAAGIEAAHKFEAEHPFAAEALKNSAVRRNTLIESFRL